MKANGRTKKTRHGEPGYRHPYVEYEADPLWSLIERGITDLVENNDIVEKEDRSYIVGYLCKLIRTTVKRRADSHKVLSRKRASD